MAQDIGIRVAQEQDIARLHSLIESAYRGDSARRGWTHEADLLGGQRTDVEALQAIVGDKGENEGSDQILLLALDGRDIAGCVHLQQVDRRLAYLGLLTVDPDRQAGGLGKILLRVAERHVGENWHGREIEMTVIRQRRDLIAYYERRGYVPTGERRPFPLNDPRYGLPKTQDLQFVVLRKEING
ncbi:GNAT family N-acetyltransferase [Parasphingorhabdus sp. JC815]|uniref:GNAT family N-acetyltransferase n=1 Tax=Parasphingorhabdus sp. JC815 TaxID=3232140 RepID=UPI0034596E86